MKKLFMFAMMSLSAVLLVAGANTAPQKAEVAEIPKKDCKNNTVYKDSGTNLMWQDAVYTDAEDGAYKNKRSLGKAGTQSHARKYCSTLIYAGYSDWRLPTSDEMQAIHRKEGQVFANARDTDFWTSTPTRLGRYFVIYPADAYRYERKPNNVNYIRCVRCTEN